MTQFIGATSARFFFVFLKDDKIYGERKIFLISEYRKNVYYVGILFVNSLFVLKDFCRDVAMRVYEMIV